MLEELFSRHERAALMFSGGKDSLATLELCRPWLDRIVVIWVNAGAQLPEIHALMDRVRAEVPHFHEEVADQAGFITENGWPVDVLPINATLLGRAIAKRTGPRLSSYLDCCANNHWAPGMAAVRRLGLTAIIRGQREDEAYRSPVKSGFSHDGVELCFPIQDWTRDDVLRFLEDKGYEIDDRLRLGHSSLDCWNCTAYLGATADRRAYMKKHHPERAHQVLLMLDQIGKTLNAEVQGLCDALTEE